jgi:pimeloyl-ACP methyl ester carboxylesterase
LSLGITVALCVFQVGVAASRPSPALVTSSDLLHYERNCNTGQLAHTASRLEPAQQHLFHDAARPAGSIEQVIERPRTRDAIMLRRTFGIVSALFALAGAAYFFVPALVYRLAMGAIRRAGRLRLREVTIDGHRVPYLEGGQGEPLILLHGFGGDKDDWTPIARLLTPHYRVIAPDLPGFGDSTRHPEARYGVDEQLQRIVEFAGVLSLDHFHLGGVSMGGYLAAMLAARCPERVDSAWLLAPAGVLSAAPSEVDELIAAGDNPMVVSDRAGFERVLELCFTTQPPMPAQFKRPMLARALAEAPFNERIYAHMSADPPPLEGVVGQIRARTLVVWGDNDRVLHPSGLDVLQGLMSDASCVRMTNMGHLPMLERPAETAADFLRFHGHSA